MKHGECSGVNKDYCFVDGNLISFNVSNSLFVVFKMLLDMEWEKGVSL